jgi:hypothetical protein
MLTGLKNYSNIVWSRYEPSISAKLGFAELESQKRPNSDEDCCCNLLQHFVKRSHVYLDIISQNSHEPEVTLN